MLQKVSEKLMQFFYEDWNVCLVLIGKKSISVLEKPRPDFFKLGENDAAMESPKFLCDFQYDNYKDVCLSFFKRNITLCKGENATVQREYIRATP